MSGSFEWPVAPFVELSFYRKDWSAGVGLAALIRAAVRGGSKLSGWISIAPNATASMPFAGVDEGFLGEIVDRWIDPNTVLSAVESRDELVTHAAGQWTSDPTTVHAEIYTYLEITEEALAGGEVHPVVIWTGGARDDPGYIEPSEEMWRACGERFRLLVEALDPDLAGAALENAIRSLFDFRKQVFIPPLLFVGDRVASPTLARMSETRPDLVSRSDRGWYVRGGDHDDDVWSAIMESGEK